MWCLVSKYVPLLLLDVLIACSSTPHKCYNELPPIDYKQHGGLVDSKYWFFISILW